MIRFHLIQGGLIGVEIDWDNKWLSLNFLFVKVVIDWNKDYIGYGY